MEILEGLTVGVLVRSSATTSSSSGYCNTLANGLPSTEDQSEYMGPSEHIMISSRLHLFLGEI